MILPPVGEKCTDIQRTFRTLGSGSFGTISGPWSNRWYGQGRQNEACRPKFTFFHENSYCSLPSPDPEYTKSREKIHFTAVITWQSTEAKLDWYTEFAAQYEDYERFGHKIDALALLCYDLAKVESKILILNNDPTKRYRAEGPRKVEIELCDDCKRRRKALASRSVSIRRGWFNSDSIYRTRTEGSIAK